MQNKIIYKLESFSLKNRKKLFLIFLPDEQPIEQKALMMFIHSIPKTLSLSLQELQLQMVVVKTMESDKEPIYYILNFSPSSNITFNTFGNGTDSFFQQFLDLSISREEANV